MKIEDIKIGDRFREELGDIDALAESIREHGITNPSMPIDLDSDSVIEEIE